MIGGGPQPPLRIYLQAEALRRAFPGWQIAVQAWSGARQRIEAVNPGNASPCCLISSDPAEIWRELLGH